MNLREELTAALADASTDPRAWVPLRRAQVEAILTHLVGVEAVWVAAKALVALDAGDQAQGEERRKEEEVTRHPLTTKDDELVAKVIEEVKRLAVDGVAPKVEEYEERKSPTLPTYKQFYNRCRIGWRDIVKRAGLQMPAPDHSERIKRMMAHANGQNGSPPRYSVT